MSMTVANHGSAIKRFSCSSDSTLWLSTNVQLPQWVGANALARFPWSVIWED